MHVTSQKTDRTLVIRVSGTLDMTTGNTLEKELQLSGINRRVLDLNECHFISSAGLRVILVARKQMAGENRTMIVTNVSPDVYGIFELTGLSKLLTVKRKIREIAMDNLQLISAGVCGECYRLDKETVVKLYHEGVEPYMAEKEKQFAQAAFVMGIPTAISYDVVACAGRTGVVFELLDAELFSTVIRNDLSNLDRHAKMLVDVAKTIHNAKGDPAVLPNFKQSFRDYITQLEGVLPNEQIRLLMEKLESVPDAETCVHFDLHSSNIMIQNGEPVIIDMGDLAIGSYLFDVGLMYTIYGVEELGLSLLATKIPTAHGVQLWDGFYKHYFEDKPAEERAFFDNNRYFFASLRIIFSITFLPKLREQLVTMLKEILIPKIVGLPAL